ncbi:MAG TPA: hypothetical protein VN493_14365 [Thermoanaerobaculia bacterium]|nr:hypothetical protein [Thermoanaerobaculia bacterium]
MRRSTPLILGLIIVLGTGTILFAAHFSPNGPSVDGDEIRYVDNTSYNDPLSWAIAEWNALDPIDILPDSAFTIADIDVFDVNDSSVSWVGSRSVRTGTDWIRMNSYYLNGYTTFQRRGTMTHEFGHALGMGDHTLSDYGSSAIIMYECSACSGVNTPQAHDEDDYDDLWN